MFGQAGIAMPGNAKFPRLEQDYGLDPGRRTKGAEEVACIAHFLDVQEDVAGLLVMHQIVEHLAQVDVERAAQRDHR